MVGLELEHQSDFVALLDRGLAQFRRTGMHQINNTTQTAHQRECALARQGPERRGMGRTGREVPDPTPQEWVVNARAGKCRILDRTRLACSIGRAMASRLTTTEAAACVKTMECRIHGHTHLECRDEHLVFLIREWGHQGPETFQTAIEACKAALTKACSKGVEIHPRVRAHLVCMAATVVKELVVTEGCKAKRLACSKVVHPGTCKAECKVECKEECRALHM